MRSHRGVAALAGRQHGVVAVGQLVDLGFSPSSIARSRAAGRLHVVHRGVYAVGRAELSDHGRCAAAVLTCGDGAVVSHAAAGWLWGLLRVCAPTVDVTVPARGHRRAGMAIHRSLTLSRPEREIRDGIPATAMPRTLLDIAAECRPWMLSDAIERTERLGLLRLAEIDAMLVRRRGARGAARLRAALDIYRDPVFSRARSERLFLDLVKDAGLPRPAINFNVAGYEVDAYWPAERFAVEIDGWDAHRSRAAFERDPIRQEALKLAGIDSIRVTARRIEREPRPLGRRLGQLLQQRRQALSQG